MKTLNRAAAQFCAALLCIGIAGPAHAQLFPKYHENSVWKPTAAEILQLPDYCQRQFGHQPAPGARKGGSLQGCPSSGMNHLCPALVAVNRANNHFGSKKARLFVLNIAEKEINGLKAKVTPACGRAADIADADRQIKMLRIVLR
jgi:hypothetical protein